MGTLEIEQLWNEAAAMDPTVRVKNNDFATLRRKHVKVEKYSRNRMFSKMADREVAVFSDMPVLVKRQQHQDTKDVLVKTFASKFPQRETSRVQVGPAHTVTRLPVREIMRRWQGDRAIVGVTDLHIRDTRVEEIIDTNALSDFNLLIAGSDDLAVQEMMTLVIASRGNVTDSHSDDPDGTNHCFCGKKLWLAWDWLEGIEAGLEDVERQDVYDKAKFRMSTFLKLKSARWFVVSDGNTLFLPGNLTHKVFTLEPYLGVGSFHVGVPGVLDTLTRWLHYGPLWSINDPKKENAGLVDETAKLTIRLLKRLSGGASPAMRKCWGFGFRKQALDRWERQTSAAVKTSVLRHDNFQQLLECMQSKARKKGAKRVLVG